MPDALRDGRTSHGDLGVHDLILRHAQATPAVTALAWRQQRVSYGVLDEMSRRVALLLGDRGVGPEVLVGLYGRRSPALVAGLLGVLRAGGGYVCFEPDHPIERLRRIAESSDLHLVLATEDAGAAPSIAGRPCVRLADVLDGSAPPAGAPVRRPQADNVATVIYTSGSVGPPKGVVLTHRALVTRLVEQGGPPGTGTRCQRASFGLAAHITDLLRPLASGRSLRIVDDETLNNPILFARALRENGITFLGVVPSQLYALLDSDEAVAELSGVTQVFVGGEALTPSIVAAFNARLPNASLTNAYGMSETAGAVAAAPCTSPDRVVVGKVYAYLTAHVLGDRMQPTAPGAVGELYIGGDQLARSYQGDPALTAERFVPDPFDRPGARLLRTGDLARHDSDGAIAVVGRADDEIKVHGHRINLREVEIAISRLLELDEVIVASDADAGALGRLRAFCLRRSFGWARAEMAQVRQQLQDRLPSYMIPTSLELVDEWPRLPTGKIDRRRLLGPATPPPGPGLTLNASATTTLERVERIWTEVFQAHGTGATDDFFGAGGDSLTAMRILSRITSDLGVELTVEDVYDNPTVAGVAAVVEGRLR